MIFCVRFADNFRALLLCVMVAIKSGTENQNDATKDCWYTISIFVQLCWYLSDMAKGVNQNPLFLKK